MAGSILQILWCPAKYPVRVGMKRCADGYPRCMRLEAGVSARVNALKELVMIILGVILLIIGFVVNIPILWTIGVVLLVIGIILYALGAAGHAIGGRRHYY